MADTVREIIANALEDIAVTSANQPATADEINTGKRHFNYLVTSREIGDWANVGDLDLGDDFPLPQELRLYFTAMLAASLAPAFGKDVPPPVADLATRGRNAIIGNLMRRGAVAIDDGLLNMPSQRLQRGN